MSFIAKCRARLSEGESYKCDGIPMDSLISAAARALSDGDLLGALKRLSLREDPPALAMRGIAMAQLGDMDRAKALLKAAARAFGPLEVVSRARCVVAEAEIALVSRDLAWPPAALQSAARTLRAHGDHANAAHAQNLAARRSLLIGRLEEAEATLAAPGPTSLPPALEAARELVVAGIALRRLQTGLARSALSRAEAAARIAAVPVLSAEVERAWLPLHSVAARLITRGVERPLMLDEVEGVLNSDALVIDACRNVLRRGASIVSLATRPVLFTLLRTLGEAWPQEVPRSALLARAFGARHVDESHRTRLRVEIGRLRSALAPFANLDATKQGYALSSHDMVVVLAPPSEERHGAMLALLADGEAWSSSALAVALGTGPRTVQRALEQLAAAGKVQPFGSGRARRWVTPSALGFPTSLLLPGPLLGK